MYETVNISFADIWDLQNFQYPWPTAAEAAIFKNFSPKELQENLTKTPVRHAVFVQCLNGSPDEASNSGIENNLNLTLITYMI